MVSSNGTIGSHLARAKKRESERKWLFSVNFQGATYRNTLKPCPFFCARLATFLLQESADYPISTGRFQRPRAGVAKWQTR